MGANGKKTILLVEDELLIGLAQAQTITQFGYAVVTTGSGRKAVDLALSDKSISLILMDIDLGKDIDDIDGTEAARRILQKRSLPIVFLTSHAEREMVEKVRDITRYGYVIKDSGGFVLQSSIEMAFELFNAHERLQRSEEQYSLINNSSGDSICSFDRADRFTSANRTFCNSARMTADQVIGKTYLELGFSEAQCAERDALHRQVYETGSTVTALTSEARPGGGVSLYEVVLTPLHDIGGNVVGISETTRDITERTMAQHALQERDAQLVSIFRAAPVGIGMVINRVIQEANESLCQMTGYSREELLGQSARILYPTDDDYNFVGKEKYREIREKGSGTVETRWKRKDGTIILIILSSTPLHPGDLSKGVTFTALDITASKRAERSLQESEERLRLALAAANQGLYDLNTQTGDAVVSPEYARMLGYEPDDFHETNARWKERLHPDDAEKVGRAYDDYIAGRRTDYRVEFRQKTKSGAWKWILSLGKIVERDGEGKPLRMLGTHTDFTDRKRAEQALEDSLARMRAIIDGAPFGAHSYELAPDGRLIFSSGNKSADVILGIDHSLLIGKTIEEAFPSLAITSIPDTYREVADTGVSYQSDQVNYEDERIRGAFELQAFQTGSKRMTVFFRDITERKRAEESVANLLREKQLLLLEVHHRIKNNMNIVMSLLSLQAERQKDPEAVGALHDARSRVKSMMVLYEKLYRSTGFKEISIKEYLSPLVEEIAGVFPNRATVNIGVQIEDAVIDTKVLSAVGIIVNELITNAMKHAFTGRKDGVIRISASLSYIMSD